MNRAVVKMLKKIVNMSNGNLLKNADGLLSKKGVDVSVEWIGKKQEWLPQNRCKMSYWFFLVG